MKTFVVQVTQDVAVTIDETKFDETFLAAFRDTFYPFGAIEDHVRHLAQMSARSLINNDSRFIEGYGPPEDMGIRVSPCPNLETEILHPLKAETDAARATLRRLADGGGR